jgi:hypothetical protein
MWGLFCGRDGRPIACRAEERIAVFRRNSFKTRTQIIDHDGEVIICALRQKGNAQNEHLNVQ